MSDPSGDVFDRVITSPEALRDQFVLAYSFARTLILNGERVHVTIKEALDPITARQRKFLKDIVFGQIAEQVKVATFDATGNATGKWTRYTKDVWAEIFRMGLLGDRWEMRKAVVLDKESGRPRLAKRATPHKVRNSTEELGVRKYSEYTDLVIDKAVVEYHVEFVFVPSEREAVRYVSKPRKERQQ